jgi:hypothetical protein
MSLLVTLNLNNGFSLVCLPETTGVAPTPRATTVFSRMRLRKDLRLKLSLVLYIVLV